MAVRYTLTTSELAAVLSAHFDITEGHWELGYNMNAQPVQAGKVDQQVSPGIVIVINGLNLAEQPESTPSTFDARELAKERTKRSKTSSRKASSSSRRQTARKG